MTPTPHLEESPTPMTHTEPTDEAGYLGDLRARLVTSAADPTTDAEARYRQAQADHHASLPAERTETDRQAELEAIDLHRLYEAGIGPGTTAQDLQALQAAAQAPPDPYAGLRDLDQAGMAKRADDRVAVFEALEEAVVSSGNVPTEAELQHVATAELGMDPPLAPAELELLQADLATLLESGP